MHEVAIIPFIFFMKLHHFQMIFLYQILPTTSRVPNAQFKEWTEMNVFKASFYSATFHNKYIFAKEIIKKIHQPPLSLVIYIYYRNTSVLYHVENEKLLY